jgi:hypothetical protein
VIGYELGGEITRRDQVLSRPGLVAGDASHL